MTVYDELSEKSVHIWHTTLDNNTDILEILNSYLTEKEKKKYPTFPIKTVQNRYRYSKGLSRYLLSKYSKQNISDIDITHNKYGKPNVKNSDIEYNVSHSKDLIVFAFTKKHPLGIDIEYKKNTANFLAIAKRFFSIEEYDQIMKTEKKKQQELFYSIWTAKEAFIKANGKGLFHDLKTFSVDIAPTLQKEFTIHSDSKKTDNMTGYHIAIHPKYRLSVVSKVNTRKLIKKYPIKENNL